MSHDDLRELSGGYALGALSDADRRAFELYARTQERRRDSRATVHFQDLDETA